MLGSNQQNKNHDAYFIFSINCDCIQVVMDNGKSDRITIVDKAQNMPAQHALTEYQVIRSSCHG